MAQNPKGMGMTEEKPIASNKYCDVWPVRVPGEKVKYEVRRKDGSLCHPFADKDQALKYAEHAELWQPLFMIHND